MPIVPFPPSPPAPSARVAAFVVGESGAARLAAELAGHEVRVMSTPAGLFTLVREWKPEVIVLVDVPRGLVAELREASASGQIVLCGGESLDVTVLERLAVHAWLPSEVGTGRIRIAVGSGLRREREREELHRHQDFLRRILEVAAEVGRLRSPVELPQIALDGFVGVLAGGKGDGAFAVQLGPHSAVTYTGVGKYAAITGHLDLPEDAAEAIARGFRGEPGVVRTERGLGLGVNGPGDCTGALYVEGVDLPASFDDLAAMFASLLGQSLSNAVLFQRSSHDALTGLYSRSFGLHRLSETLALAARHAEATGMMVIDVDHFKRVNDTLGHAAGDLVLVALADLVRSSCRISDVPARLGGEEFVVVLPRTDEATAALVAERFRRVVAAWRGKFEGAELQMTVSIGVAASEPGELDAAQLVARADDALYAAKREGRNRVVRAG